ncbi:response regulator [Leptospira borgpetersenii serovar Hardjo-bovis]|uniref:histidine kinase n=1 Tax=Leptospira borgpetersenii serovar Hardjo-bovis str. Sponselee TaxID=1303729 RepID=M6CA37_LEPBO|nr:response regulator [Leptospira borgpetersenii]AMX58071.1 histidine kinase [Leptospira borgpetersenii serovar Hardjo]AMX61323.1 histidine kinase [Leptospira borgpetersenii serovar Hardjo]AMX64568.1 histidine kinase [Leptospira borgpetersenii serovar Hardjo]AMX67786.1 histidine kinase [Leptospira borgpetersenii serovar Hardjo]AYR08361.1 response regulator [Leptospira borgpetersenii serovar Hardjo-bovis]
MTIRRKLIIGFSIILTILFISVLFVIEMLSDSNERLKRIVDLSAKKVSLSHEILIYVLEASRHEKNIILERDYIKKLYYKDRLYKAIDSADQKMIELEMYADRGGSKALDDFKSLWATYKSDVAQIVFFALKNNENRAFEISIRKGLIIRDSIIKTLDYLVKKSEKEIQSDKQENEKRYYFTLLFLVLLILTSFLIEIAISYWIIRTISLRIQFIAKKAEKIANREFSDNQLADFANDELRAVYESLNRIRESFKEITDSANNVASGNYLIDFVPKSEKDVLGNSLRTMTSSLRKKTQENEKHNWIMSGQNLLNERLRGDKAESVLSNDAIIFLSNYLKANVGAIYLCDDQKYSLSIFGRYGFTSTDCSSEKFILNEGLIGQAAADQKQVLLTNVEEESIRIISAVIDTKPKEILIVPFMFEGKTEGVIELGKLDSFSSSEIEFVSAAVQSIGISFNSSRVRRRVQELLEQTRIQSEELQTQQEELKQMNEELEEQTQILRQQQEELKQMNEELEGQTQILRQQQEELKVSNEELEEQTRALEMRNKELELAKNDIEQKTEQLELSGKYKSEFLANMSHELRTPLNSLLILSKDLADNKKKNLDEDQVESANIIYKSGHDLLVLINEVLDLSKIESGKMSVNLERVVLRTFVKDLISGFKLQATKKKLDLDLIYYEDLPEKIRTDPQRLDQILKNLISNALKFTERGRIQLEVKRQNSDKILFSVIDSGIGIPEEKYSAIFEAFQQVDGSTSRKYGGTGLGLSISRELAGLLGGEIHLKSKVNKGSTFSLLLPIEGKRNETSIPKEETGVVADFETFVKQDQNEFVNYPALKDDRNEIVEGDKILLIVEDDLKFASILLKQANEKGFRGISAATGEDGLVLARKHKPHAILLDLDLPGMDGHAVLNELKADQSVRHIPVHIISAKEYSLKLIRDGAVEYIKKPVNKKQLDEAFNRIEHFISRKMKNLLIIEDDANSRSTTRKLIGNDDVKCFEASSGKEALSVYSENHFDCIVLDIGLPDMSGFDLIREMEKIKEKQIPPIIIYTGRELTKEESKELQEYSESIIIKGIKSEERLLDETALVLHRMINNLPESKQNIINRLYDKDAVFFQKRIMLVDDDMRNVFALSKILSEKGMEVLKAENGNNALELLSKSENVDMILMDVMMPEMDGYEATRRIRSNLKYKDTVIIALTAKAMNDDRQKCIDAGANDYISKPVDVERLFSLMRVWLSR